MDIKQKPTQHILSLSYGKDSIAMIEACKQLGYPVDRIITAEVYATDTIPADLPPMVEFKKKADKIILDRYGIEVEHIWATKRERECSGSEECHSRLSFERQFYTKRTSKKYNREDIYGFPMIKGAWCNDRLKTSVLDRIAKADLRERILQNPFEEEGNAFKNLCERQTNQARGDYRIPQHKSAMVQRCAKNEGNEIFR